MEAFITSIGSILSIVLLIVLGYILKEKNWFSDSFSGNISKLIMNIALPASIFVSVLKYLTLKSLLSLTGALVYTFLSVIIGYIFAYILVKILNVPVGRRGTFINTVVNANTIFIGLPLNIALFGNESLPYFLVYYVVNTLSTFTVGTYLFAYYNQQHVGKGIQWSRIFSPPLIAFLGSMIWVWFGWTLPDFLDDSLIYIGSLVTPLSLMYIGIHLAQVGLRSLTFDGDMRLAIFGRFVLFPAILLIIQVGVMQLFSIELPMKLQETFFLQSTIPTLVIMPLLATEENADIDFATSAVTITTLFYIVILPVWMMLFSIAFQS